jgi:molybdenum cofactor guanylyltransferase
MGRDKAWIEYEGQPLIRRQISLARELGAAEVFISGRSDGDYATLRHPVLTDKFPDAGPLAGIERALETTTSPLLLVLAVDLPAMRLARLQEILGHCHSQTGAIPRIGGNVEPLVAIYPARAHHIAVSLLTEGHNAVQELAQRCVQLQLAAFVDLETEAAGAFANWNTPADTGPS